MISMFSLPKKSCFHLSSAWHGSRRPGSAGPDSARPGSARQSCGSLILPLLLFLSLMLFTVSSAHSADKNSRAQVEQMLAMVGILPVVEDIPVIMAAGIRQKFQEQSELGADTEQFKQLVDPAVKKYFSHDAIMDKMTVRLAPLLQGQRGEALKKLLSSSRAKKIVGMKNQSRSEKSLEAIKNVAVDHENKNIPKQRLELLEEFDNATADTEFFIAVQALSIDSILRLSNAYSLKTQNKAFEGMKKNVLASTYELLLRPSRYTTMMTYRHMFRDSSDNDIRRYIELYRQSHVQWLLQNTMVTISTVMEEATIRAVKEIHG